MAGDMQSQMRDVWNWLPTFRVIAETEHLPTAAERLHVTPAAISRTLKLLEDRLDRSLFNREGRSLVLNENGRKLLEEVRSGMTSVERGLRGVTRAPLDGPVRVASIGVLTNYFVTPGLLDLTDRHDSVEPILQNMRTRESAQAVLRGEIDVAFFYESMTFEGLHVEKMGETTSSIYCGPGHPLFEREDVSLEELLEHPFSVPGIGDTGRVMDDWPTDISRKIGMRIMLLTTNLRICRSGRFVCVLPDVAAREWLESGDLRRFPFDLLPPTDLYAARRETDDENGAAARVIDAVQGQVARLEEEVAALRNRSN